MGLVLFWPDGGLVEGFGGRVSDQVAVVAVVGLDFFAGGRGDDGEVGGSTEQSAD